MNGYVAITILILSRALFLIVKNMMMRRYWSDVDSAEHINSFESELLRDSMKRVQQIAFGIGLLCVLAFCWTWWTDRTGLLEDSVAIAAFADSSDGIGGYEGGRDTGYCYGPWGGREDSSPCVVIVSDPRVIERPGNNGDNWCFLINYLVETNKIDTGVPWNERTLEAENQQVSVCGKLTRTNLDGNGTKHDYRSWTYTSEELVQDKIRDKHNYGPF